MSGRANARPAGSASPAEQTAEKATSILMSVQGIDSAAFQRWAW